MTPSQNLKSWAFAFGWREAEYLKTYRQECRKSKWSPL